MGSNLCWSFIELDRHPECLAKLMTEINSVDIMDFTTINSKMPYLDAFFMEINRLYPTVHATLRVMNHETTLWAKGKPAILKPGMVVFINYRHLHTSPEFWGPNAREFVPERFLGGYNKEQPFMAFGYGPRNCVRYSVSWCNRLIKETETIRLVTNSQSLLPKSILRYCSKSIKSTSKTTITRCALRLCSKHRSQWPSSFLPEGEQLDYEATVVKVKGHGL